MDEKQRKKSVREKRNAFYVILIVILVVVLSSMIVVLKLRKIYGDNICLSADCVNSSEFFLDIINNSINPCENFYEFACGGYEGPTSTLEEAQLRVVNEFKSLTTGNINENDPLSVKKQKKYYTACMNTSAIEEDDNRSLKKIFEKLGGWPPLFYEWVNSYNFEKIIETCIDLGLSYDWFVDVGVNDEDSENVTLRISAPKTANKIERQYKDNYQLLIENILKILRANNSLDYISEAAKSIVEFENSLAHIISESGNTYSKTSIEELRIGFPSLPWDALTKHVYIKENATIEGAISYFPRLIRFLEKNSPRTKVNYILWKITENLYQFLPRHIRREFEAYKLVTKNETDLPRNLFCFKISETIFAYVSESAYAQKYAPDRETVKRIFKNIKIIMHDHINASKWMNHTHKAYALNKLQKVKIMIGGPDEVFDTRKFDEFLGIDKIDILNLNNTLDIVRAVDKSRDKYNLNLRRKQITDLRARLYQGIVNIHSTKYLPPDNLIYLPAAFIGGVFDYQKGLNFRNYSVLGIVIAHELAHAFGILDTYDPFQEKSKMTWSNSSFQAFLNESQCLMDQCLEMDGLEFTNNTQCIKTFEENFADYASVDIAYEAFKRTKAEGINQLPGLKYQIDQLFWISYAATMCDSINNKTTNGTFLLSHLEPSKRILGSYRNSKYFAGDFGCQNGSYMNPVDKCVVL
ncbi:unnamed protein product [Psylliodes chrysocephalus]|uniref:Uncharacterized protein n=1 Tax=Psylliodes chrysocephalus TaxID=3402493 RepID=A0A9P0GFR5_9CUCU|nr:unnamed protein product [Psylliodes chrysocephala]